MVFNRIERVKVLVCTFVMLQLCVRMYAMFDSCQPELPLHELWRNLHLVRCQVVFDRDCELEVWHFRQFQSLQLLQILQVGAHLRIVLRSQVGELDRSEKEHKRAYD